MEFDHYDQVPKNVEAEIVEGKKNKTIAVDFAVTIVYN